MDIKKINSILLIFAWFCSSCFILVSGNHSHFHTLFAPLRMLQSGICSPRAHRTWGHTDSPSGQCQMRRRFRSYSREIDVNINSFQKLGSKKHVSSRLFWGIWEYRLGRRGVGYSCYHFMLFMKSSNSSRNFRSGLAYLDLFKQMRR